MDLKTQLQVYKILGYVAQAIGVLSVGFIALTILGLLKSVNRARPLKVKRIITSVVLSVGSFALFMYVSKIQVEDKQWFIYGGIGAVLGYIWAGTVRIHKKGDTVTTTNTLWYLLVWGVTFGLTQVFSMLKGKYLNAAMMSAITSTTIVLAMNAIMYMQYKKVTVPAAAPPAPTKQE
jgi:hypothetical protein